MNQEVINLTKDYRNSIYAISLTKGRQEIDFDQWGAGEYKITCSIREVYGNNIVIYIPFTTFATLEKASVFKRFCQKQKVSVSQVVFGYLAYGRQERETTKEPTLLGMMTNIICDEFVDCGIIEPHDYVSVINRFDTFYWTAPQYGKRNLETIVVSPDKGAGQRLRELGITPRIKIEKNRTDEGVISEIGFDDFHYTINAKTFDGTFVIYDDICDGGRTFANVAELVKERYPNAKIELYVAHAILPYGVESLKGKIDKIVALDTCFPVGIYFDGFLEIRSAMDMFF